MPAQLSGLTSGARRLLAGFTAGQKAVTGVALLAILGGLLAFTSWASKPALVPVFTDLSDQMTQLMIAQRGYQANLSVVERAKDAYSAALRLGQRS